MRDVGDESKRIEVFKPTVRPPGVVMQGSAMWTLYRSSPRNHGTHQALGETVSSLKEKLACDFFRIVVVSRLAVDPKD
jgi:hypothetical protein